MGYNFLFFKRSPNKQTNEENCLEYNLFLSFSEEWSTLKTVISILGGRKERDVGDSDLTQ